MSIIVSTIGNIIVNMFSSDLTSASMNCIDKLKFKRFQKELSKYVQKYVLEHDGTVLTNGCFERFLTNYHPLEYAFSNISGAGDSISKELFIAKQMQKFWDSFPDEKADYWNQTVLKDFLDQIYNRIENYYKNCLSKNQVYLSNVVKRIGSELESHIDDSTKILSGKIDNSTEKIEKFEIKIDELHALLAKENELDKEEAWNIFSVLSKSILNGSIKNVETFVPLMKGKSVDLETGIKYYLDLFQGISHGSNSLSTIEGIIEDDRIYQDLAEKTIYFSLIFKSEELLNQIGNRNLTIYEIKGYLLAKKYDVFYSLEKQKKDGFILFKYKMQNNFPEHNWLVRRICTLSVLEQPILDASDVVRPLLDDENLIDRIIICERRVNELANKLQIEDESVKALHTEFSLIMEKIDSVPIMLQTNFFTAYLKWGVICSTEDTDQITALIPRSMRQEIEIEMLFTQIDINKGNRDFDKIIEICNKANQYWLFNNALGSLVMKKPEEAKRIMDKYRFVLDKDPMIFLLYVQLSYNFESNDSVELLFKEYLEKYGKYLEYWVIKLQCFFNEDELTQVVRKWLNSEYEHVSNRWTIDFINLLIKHGRYSDALQGILQIERNARMSQIPVEYLRAKAIALLNTNHHIESLDVFNKIFSEYSQTDESAFYILILSINNKRVVSDKVINFGKASDNPDVLLATAQYAEINSIDGAEQLIIKALLRTKRTDKNGIQAYGKYLGFHTKEDNTEEIVIKSVDSNTVIHMQDQSGETISYCIHGYKVLPHEFYEWEGAKHIYKDTAIRLGLFRRKTNDEIEIDSVKYTIMKIEPLDYYLFHVCMNKLVQTERAHVIMMQSDEDGHIDTELFKKQIQEQIGDISSKDKWLKLYKNLEEMPASINLYSEHVSVTYSQLIDLMIQDQTIFIREVYGENNGGANYVISTASIIALRRIGFDLQNISNQIAISSSLKKIISDDADITIRDNNREHVASLIMEKGQLYYLETPDEVKQQYISDAVALKDYIAPIQVVVNDKDLPEIGEGELDVKEFLGIADYDSLSVARKRKLTLVASEIPLYAIANMKNIEVETISIASFLSSVCKDINDLLKYTERLMEYRFLVPFDEKTVIKVAMEYANLDEEGKNQLLHLWQNVLLLPIKDEKYKEQLGPFVREILNKLKDSIDNMNPIWTSLLHTAVNYSGYTVRVTITNGEIQTLLIKDSDSQTEAMNQ